jgi:hypothetical protein
MCAHAAPCDHQGVSEPPYPVQKNLSIAWTGVEAVPIQMANQFLVQVDASGERPDQLVIAVGQVMPPPVLGTPEEMEAALERLSEVSIQTLARFSVTPTRLAQLVELLRKAQLIFESDAAKGEAAS